MGPGLAPRLAYSKEQRDKLEATANKVAEFPFNLKTRLDGSARSRLALMSLWRKHL